jgi:aspartate carbamoyltransferase catalytic subunit
MKHILSAKQFETQELRKIFDSADQMRKARQGKKTRSDLAARHSGCVVATLFYEPSTRTRLSFEAAAQALGGGVISTENAGEFSSAVKGETIEDTVRTVARYAEVVIIRHKEKGAIEKAAAAADGEVAIINAGDGDGEHPTQALIDLYTIRREKGRTENLKVVIGGDLVKGRTARSLSMMLSKYKENHITFVSLPELSISDDIKHHLKETGTTYTETDDMHQALHDADVVYWTRLQLERHNGNGNMKLEKNFVIDQKALQTMKDDAIILHPLPRNNEIEQSVDSDPRAKYFDQVENGLYIRMALIDELLGAR